MNNKLQSPSPRPCVYVSTPPTFVFSPRSSTTSYASFGLEPDEEIITTTAPIPPLDAARRPPFEYEKPGPVRRMCSAIRRFPYFLVVILALISLMSLSVPFGYDSISATQLGLQESRHLSATQVGILFSAYAAPTIVANIVAGWLTDRIGIIAMSLISISMAAAGSSVVAFSQAFWGMVLGRVIQGIGSESSSISQESLLSMWFKDKFLNLSFGIQTAIEAQGSTLAFWVLSAVLEAPALGSTKRLRLDIALWIVAGVHVCALVLNLIYILLVKTVVRGRHCRSTLRKYSTFVDNNEEYEPIYRPTAASADSATTPPTTRTTTTTTTTKQRTREEATPPSDDNLSSSDNNNINVNVNVNINTGNALPSGTPTTTTTNNNNNITAPDMRRGRIRMWFAKINLHADFWLLTIISLCFTGSIYSFVSFVTAYMVEKHHFTPHVASRITSIIQASVILAPLLGAVVDRLGRRTWLFMSMSLAYITCFVLLGVTKFSPVPMVIIIGLSFSVTESSVHACVPLIVSQDNLGKALGIMGAVENLGLVICPIATGAMREASGSYDCCMLLFAGFNVGAFVVALALRIVDGRKGGRLNMGLKELNQFDLEKKLHMTRYRYRYSEIIDCEEDHHHQVATTA